jgi:hypothetical protein
MMTEGSRVVCVREVQNSIKDSVKQLIDDWLERLDIGPEFNSLRDEIKGPRGSLCLFRGMNDQNAESIKSLEGADVAWWEEAQTAADRSWRLLRPTIRKPGSQIWATWNPRFRTDPVDHFYRAGLVENLVSVRPSYADNPWFTPELEAERQTDLAFAQATQDYARYRHVWLGDYEEVGDRQFIGAGLVRAAFEAEAVAWPHDELVMGVDVGRYGDDETVIAIRRGRDGRSEPWVAYRGLDTMEVAARIADHMDRLHPDAVFVDETGVGAGVVDRLRQLGRRITPVNFGARPDGLTAVKTANKRAEMWQRMKEWLSQGSVALPRDDKLEVQLTGVEYRHDANNAILLERKEDMRKRGLASPDRADALALTFAYPAVRSAYAQDDWEDSGYRGRSSATGY